MKPEGRAAERTPGIAGAMTPFGWAALSLALLHAVLGLLLYEPTLFPGGDNAGYMILGDALRGGHGYRDLYLPAQPLHAKYPPLLPALLAVLGWLGGLQLFKLVMLACTTAAVWLTARVGRDLAGEGPALLAAALLALNPTLLEYGHYVLSEAPFVLLVLLALYGTLREDRAGDVVAVLAAVGAFATRTAGLTVLLAVPIGWVVRGRRRAAATAAAAALATMVLWGLYQRWAAPGQPGYLHELILIDPYDPAAGSVGAAGLVARAARNLWAYVGTVVPQTVLGAGRVGTPLALLGVAFSGLALFGWARRARREPGAPVMFVLLYAGLIAVWPDVWTDRRFLLPLVPLLSVFALGGLADAGPRLRRWVPIAVVLVIGVPCVAWIVDRVPERMECVASYRAGSPCDAPAFASLYAAARWAAEHTEPDAVVVNRKPRLFYWISRRRGDVYPYSSDPETVMAAIDGMGADYVVVDQVSGTTPRYLVPAIRAHQARFEPVYEGGAPPSYIFRVHPPVVNAQ